MKPTLYIAIASLFALSACNTEPTDAAKANGAVNTSTPGNFEPEAFAEVETESTTSKPVAEVDSHSAGTEKTTAPAH